jgi:hypothetical protein
MAEIPDGFAARAIERRTWPLRRHLLEECPSDDLSDSTTPEERVEMMWPLAVEAWTLAGRGLPDYPREEIPARIFRPGDEALPDEED